MKVNQNSAWQTAQGMARMNIGGKFYLVCCVIKTGDYSDRNSAKTMIYIVDEESGKTVEEVTNDLNKKTEKTNIFELKCYL